MADTKVVLISSGEWIIAKYTENTDGTVTLIDALSFRVVPSKEDPKIPGLMFGTAFPFAKDPSNVTFPKTAITLSMEPNTQIEEAHRAQTSSIITAKNVNLPKLR